MWSQKAWSDFIVIEQQNQSSLLPYVLLDEEDNIHLIYMNKIDKYYDIIYKRKPSGTYDNTVWDKEVTAYSRCSEAEMPIILKSSNQLHIIWQSDMKVFCCSSNDDGVHWNPPTQFMAGRYGKVVMLGCRLSPDIERDFIICDWGYGYVNDEDVTLYMVSDLFDKIIPSKQEPEYKNEGYEVEEFASKNAKAFGASNTTSTDLKTFFKNTTPQPSTDSSNQSANVEITKLRIMLNMMQEEIVQTKKKISEFEQVSANASSPYEQERHQVNSEITDIRNELVHLSAKIDTLNSILNKITSSDLTRMNRDISNLKRKNSGISFYDLLPKTSE